MRKISLLTTALVALLCVNNRAHAQILSTETQDVTVTMDLQPVFQLDLVGSDEVDFVFDNISRYINGVTKNKATRLRVSSTVDWDLSVIQGGSPSVVGLFDVLGTTPGYPPTPGSNGVTTIPVNALQLQILPVGGAITGAVHNFTSWASLSPNGSTLEDCTGTPAATAYGTSIAGSAANPGTAPQPPGDYHHLTGASTSAFEFEVSYRIIPNLPATFSTIGCGSAATSTAMTVGTTLGLVTQTPTAGETTVYGVPGYYGITVQYVLAQD